MNIKTTYTIPGTKITSPYPVKLTPAETRLAFSLQKLFMPENILVDIYFPSPHRATNLLQIDCLAINQQGIFIFESKDYGGWIYGNAKQRYWTQTLNFGRAKHQFYNPVFQNSSHITAIRDLIPSQFPIYSIIVFGHETTLKTISHLPDYCYVCTQPQMTKVIASLKSPFLLQAHEITSLRQTFEKSRIYPDHILRRDHNTEIQESFYQNKTND